MPVTPNPLVGLMDESVIRDMTRVAEDFDAVNQRFSFGKGELLLREAVRRLATTI